MANEAPKPDERDVVTGRGMVSGSGDPLPDADALAILEERVAPPTGDPVSNGRAKPGSE